MAKADTAIAAEDIAKIINVFKPDTVITFEPNGITGHDDHRTVCAWTTEAVKQSGTDLDSEFNVFFNTIKPKMVDENAADICIKLDDELLKCKLRCLQAHASQTSKMFASKQGHKAVKIMAATECFIASK